MVWGHIAVLAGSSAILLAIAVVGVNKRDLRGQTTGVTLLDRLRANPTTRKVAERVAGSTRVSRLWIKTASEHQGLLLVCAVTMLAMGALIGPMYALIDESIKQFADQLPEALLAMVGNGDMGTPEGFYQIETFSLMAPIAVMIIAMTIGARATAGEEERRTIGILLANPVKRSTIVLEKTVAMIALAAAVGLATFAGTIGGSLLGRLGMSVTNTAAVSLMVTLLGLVFGALTLALAAATGRVKLAVYTTMGVALTFYLLNSFLPLNESVAEYARWSPFYYYLTSDPLNNGIHWGHTAVLAALFVGLVAVSVWIFDRRDLRQTG